MAFDHTGLFTVMGKYIKWINTLDGYIDALETNKEAVYAVLDSEDLEDLYVNLPTLTASWQNNVGSWINSLISEVGKVLVDRDYVIEQLTVNAVDTTTILNAIYDYMVDNSYSFKASVVSLGGSDTDKSTFMTKSGSYAAYASQVFVSRFLDGTNAPSSIVSAHQRYNQEESQLAKSTTMYARVTSETSGTTRGAVEIFSKAPFTGPYTFQDEEPGNGPTLTDAESNNLIATNFNFETFTTNTPDGWTMAGGTAGTDWEGTTGTNTLKMNTVGVTATQKITNLSRYKTYLAAVYIKAHTSDDTAGLVDASLNIVDVNGGYYQDKNGNYFSDTVTNLSALYSGTPTLGVPYEITRAANYKVLYIPFSLGASHDPNNVYLQISCDGLDDNGAGGADPKLYIYKAVVTPMTYYNGLGLAYWVPILDDVNTLTESSNLANGTAALKSVGSLAVANDDAGKFQAYFRKAHNVQMPTAASPTVSDSLAT